MSRLFGLILNDPQRVACALYPAREALVAGAAPEGWGLAFFQGGEVLLQRHPKPPSTPLDFFKASKDLRTDYIVGHVADPGTPAKLESTQPYRFRSWVYAQSGGSTPGLLAPDAKILEHIPDFLRRNIRAHTAAERVFHVLLAQLHDSGKIDDPNLRVGDAAAALRRSITLALDLAQTEGGAPLDAMATNGRIFLAVRNGKPLFLNKVNGLADCRLCAELLPENERRDRRRTAHEHVRAVIMVSHETAPPGEGWEEVPDGSIVAVTRELETSIVPLRPPG